MALVGGTNGRVDLRFGQDELGEVYILTKQDGKSASSPPRDPGDTWRQPRGRLNGEGPLSRPARVPGSREAVKALGRAVG